VSGQQPNYDLVLKGGRVLDPRNGIDGKRDVAIKRGRIAAVAADIDAGAGKVRDVAGSIVAPARKPKPPALQVAATSRASAIQPIAVCTIGTRQPSSRVSGVARDGAAMGGAGILCVACVLP